MGGGAVWDDSTLIAGRLLTLDGAGLLDLWAGPISASGPGSTYYRPLALSLMAIVGRSGMWALHLLALVAHAVSAGLLVHLCRRARAPVWAGLIFALHPLASEVLGWASALPDALAVCFGLLAVAAGGGLGMAAALVAGVLCKETALLIPLCFGLAGGLRDGWWKAWVGALIFIIGLRYAVDVRPPPELWHKVGLVPDAMGWSLSGVIWPHPLSAVRDVRLAPGWTAWVGILVILLMAVGARRNRAAWAGIGLLAIAPAVALPTVLDGYLVAERYMYPGLVGLGLWAAHVLPDPRRASHWGGAAALGALCMASILQRAPAWKNDAALFDAATQADPGSSLAWHLRGMVHLRAGESSLAADAFGRAIESGHPYPTDRTLRLRALVEAGRVDEAARWAESGPKEGLTAEHMAWWAKASFESGDRVRAAQLIAVLRTPAGLDGPLWLRELAERIDAENSGRSQEGPEAP